MDVKLYTETVITDNKKLGRGNRKFHGETIYIVEVNGEKSRVSKSYYEFLKKKQGE